MMSIPSFPTGAPSTTDKGVSQSKEDAGGFASDGFDLLLASLSAVTTPNQAKPFSVPDLTEQKDPIAVPSKQAASLPNLDPVIPFVPVFDGADGSRTIAGNPVKPEDASALQPDSLIQTVSESIKPADPQVSKQVIAATDPAGSNPKQLEKSKGVVEKSAAGFANVNQPLQPNWSGSFEAVPPAPVETPTGPQPQPGQVTMIDNSGAIFVLPPVDPPGDPQEPTSPDPIQWSPQVLAPVAASRSTSDTASAIDGTPFRQWTQDPAQPLESSRPASPTSPTTPVESRSAKPEITFNPRFVETLSLSSRTPAQSKQSRKSDSPDPVHSTEELAEFFGDITSVKSSTTKTAAPRTTDPVQDLLDNSALVYERSEASSASSGAQPKTAEIPLLSNALHEIATESSQQPIVSTDPKSEVSGRDAVLIPNFKESISDDRREVEPVQQTGVFVQEQQQTSADSTQFKSTLQSVAHQISAPIVEMASQLAHRETRTLRLQLRPEKLGQIDLQITRDSDGRLSAHITAESATTSKALSDGMNLLRRSLEQTGLNVDRLDVSLATNSGQQHGSREASDREATRVFSSISDASLKSDGEATETSGTEPKRLLNLRI